MKIFNYISTKKGILSHNEMKKLFQFNFSINNSISILLSFFISSLV